MQLSISFALELIGTVAFAASGAMLGIKKRMDLLGVCMLGLCVAVGGGVMRDIILGCTPPITFQNPIYALCAVLVSIILFFPAVRRFFAAHSHKYELIMQWMDAIGLAIFTAVGVNRCYLIVPDAGVFLVVFVGVLTGVGGGVLRDVLAGDMPYIFRKHFYASASIIGALVTVIIRSLVSNFQSLLTGSAVVLILRVLAAHYRWKLPKAVELPENE